MGETSQVELSCLVCESPFLVSLARLAKGQAKYCSMACYGKARVGVKRSISSPSREERACVVCGKTFTIGGRGNAVKAQRMCSLECQQAGRYRRGAQTKQLTVAEAAYIAGLVDGEGSIILFMRRTSLALRLSLNNTHFGVLDWLAQTTGVGNVMDEHGATDVRRPTRSWRLNGIAVSSLLQQIRPYMRIKAEQADLAIAMQERLRTPALKADREWQVEWKEKMQAMNKRGPREPDGE